MSRACNVSASDVGVICRVTYFQFQFSLLVFYMGRYALAALRRIGFKYAITDIGRCRKFV